MSFNPWGDVTRDEGIGIFAFPKNYTIIDLETTGLSPSNCEIIEMSAIRVRENEIVESFSSLVKPKNPVEEIITNLTGINNDMLETAPSIEDVLHEYISFIGTDYIVGHNVTFDLKFLKVNSEFLFNETIHNDYIDTFRISKRLIHDSKNYKLGTLAEYFGIVQEKSHRALADCKTTKAVFEKLGQLNADNEQEFINKFQNCGDILKGKKVVFKGKLSYCTIDGYSKICEMAGGTATTIFLANSDYIVFGKTTYEKFKRGDYSYNMSKAIELQEQGTLTILSEIEFAKLLGVEIAPQSSDSNSGKFDMKSLRAETDNFDTSHPLYDKVCVFTGVLDHMQRKDAMQAVLNCGGRVGDSVTKKTNYLILGCNDFCSSIKNGKSSKHKKAEEYKQKGYDIEIIDEVLFYTMISEE